MGKYDKKFGFEEDDSTADFHRSRRMFVIKDDELVIAEPNLSFSHPQWFEHEGWMNESNDEIMELCVRGAVLSDGEVRFYIGWDFTISQKAEDLFMLKLGELVGKLNLDTSALLTAGNIKEENFKPRKTYGTIADNLKA